MSMKRTITAVTISVVTLIHSSSVWAEFQTLLSGKKVDLLERRVYNNYKLWNCEDQDMSDPRLTQSKEYLNDIIDLIIGANPDVFKLEYARSEFCLFVPRSSSGSQSIMSAGDMGNGALIFSNFSDGFENDAEVAATIAHELAHVTLQHYRGSPSLHPGVKDQVIAEFRKKYFIEYSLYLEKYLLIIREVASKQNLPEWLKQSAQKNIDVFSNLKLMADTQAGSVAESTKIDWNRPSESEDIDLFFSQLNSLGYGEYVSKIQQLDENAVQRTKAEYQSRLDRLIGEIEIGFWMEIEADLVGLRYYLRAGYSPDSLIDFWVRRGNLDSKVTGIKCNNPFNETPDIFYPLEIKRQLYFGQTHPTNCWRAWRLAKEIEFLKKDGWSFGTVVNSYENGSHLKRVKEEERNIQKELTQ